MELSFKLIITVALKQEIPDIFNHHPIPIVTLKSLLAGDTRLLSSPSPYLCIITGVGRQCSEQTAQWIIRHCSPLCVINIGTAGSNSTSLSQGDLVIPIQFKHTSLPTVEGIGVYPFLINVPLKKVNTCYSITEKNEEINSPCIIDMEAYWQARVFKTHHIPFTSVKYITDDHNHQTTIHFMNQLPHVSKAFNTLWPYLSSPHMEGISVIIPTYNRKKTLKRAIDSVLYQTIPVQCIVVDDGSTDTTSELLASYNDLINVIVHDKNQGVSAARNTGIKHAKYECIMFLDSDDEWDKNKCKAQYQYIKTYPFFSILQSEERWIRHGKHLNKKKYHKKSEGFIFVRSLARCLITPSSVMIHRSILKQFGIFNPQFPACEDYDLWLRISRHMLIGLEPSCTLTKYAGHENQLSMNVIALDQYRIHSLKTILIHEFTDSIASEIKKMLKKKTMIYTQGKKKRHELKQRRF